MSLYNPFDNNKTLYVYQISGSLQTTNVYTSTDIYSFIGYSNPGTMFTPHNVSFGHSSISTMECFIQGTLVGRSKFESFRVKSGANPTFLDFQEDIIKIPPGYGITTEFIASQPIECAINYRYYEE
jgi:hypothetical protein